jgi:hypothetical protein
MTDQTKKQNTGKPPVFQGVFAYFPNALREVAKVSAYGKDKHQQPLDAKGWLDVPLADLQDAHARHTLDQLIDGEVNEADGGVLHKAQIAWKALAVLEVYLRNRDASPGVTRPTEAQVELMRGPFRHWVGASLS